MTNNLGMPSIDAWQAESLRVTTFPAEVVSIEQNPWWDKFVGVPPEAVVSRPKTGLYEAHGEFEGRRLGLQIQPGRIEWNLRLIEKGNEEFDLLSIGPFPEVLASLLKIVSSWLPQAPALSRFALGGALVQPVGDVPSGLALLQRYLSTLTIDPGGSSDLLYQINRPRPSTSVDGLQMNRLSKWSVQVTQRVTMTIGPANVITRAVGSEAAGRLELDINTSPTFGQPLPAQHLAAVLQEMASLGREIAQAGDIR